MMELVNGRRNNICLLLCLFISLSVFIVCYTFSKYKTTLASSDSTRVGKFVIKDNVMDSFNIDISDIDPDNPVIYNFYVSNYDNNGRAEVNIDYKLLLLSVYGNLPLIYTLTKVGSNDNLLDENNSYSDRLDFNQDEKVDYILKISISDDAYEYQDIVDEVRLNIEAIQRD